MDKIANWLSEFPKEKCLLVSGNHGVGKTTKVKNLLLEQNYHIHYFNTANFNKKGIIKDHFLKIIQSSNIWVMMKNPKKSIIVIDELEGISLNDRGSMTEIIDLIKISDKQTNPIPIICIGNDAYFKKQKDLAKWCSQIYIPPPTNQELCEFLKQLCKQCDMKISKQTAINLIQESQKDYNRLQNLFNYMCLDRKSLKITDLKKIVNSTDQKRININLYEATEKLLYQNISFKETLDWFREEKTLLPMMIHQNYQLTNDKKLLAQVSDIISYSNTIELFLYQKNEWDLMYFYAFASCYLPGKMIIPKSKKEMIYTKMLNKISLQHTYIHKLQDKTMKKSDYYFDKTLQQYTIASLYKSQNMDQLSANGLTIKELNDMIKYI